MIWFYPLNDLEISGYETFVAVLFSPILLAMPILKDILKQPWALMCLRYFMHCLKLHWEVSFN